MLIAWKNIMARVIKWQSHPTYYTHNSDKQKENQIVSSHYFESIHTKNSQKTDVLYVLRQNLVIIMCIFTAYSIALGEETERITKSYRSAHNVIEIKQNDNTTNYHNNAHNHTYDL